MLTLKNPIEPSYALNFSDYCSIGVIYQTRQAAFHPIPRQREVDLLKSVATIHFSSLEMKDHEPFWCII